MTRRGQSMLYAVLVLPTLLLVFGLAAELGSMRLQQLRLRWAVDTAAVDAATAIDAPQYARTGSLTLDPSRAAEIAREYLVRNLSQLGALGGGDAGAHVIAERAEITVVNRVPARDPFSGVLLDRAAVCLRVRAPYRTTLLAFFGLPRQVELVVTADAEVKQ